MASGGVRRAAEASEMSGDVSGALGPPPAAGSPALPERTAAGTFTPDLWDVP